MSNTLHLDRGLEKIDYIFRFTGMNLEKRKKTAYEIKKYKIIHIFSSIWMNTDVAGAIWWFVQGALRGESLTSLTHVAPCITISILANLKSIYFVTNRDHVDELIDTLRHLEIEESRRPEAREKKRMIKEETDFLYGVLRVLHFVNWALIIAFPLMPLSFILIKYIRTRVFEPMLPFLVVYPFDAFDVRVWPFVYIKQVGSELAVVLKVCGVDYLFYIACLHICLQFRLLQHDVTHMSAGYGGTNLSDLKARFVYLIRWHLKLIHSVQHLEAIYSKSTLFNFVSSSALICLTGFNVTTIDDKAFAVSFLSFLFLSLLQIFFLCFFGDMVMRSSLAVSDAVYSSQWYMRDAKNAKYLLCMLVRAQKPCKLTAFGYKAVNLMAFMKILGTSWSYFALLKTVYSSDDRS